MNWWDSGPALARLWFMSMETCAASAVVIAKRSAMLGNAGLFPDADDMKEFGRIVPEKMEAFTHSMIGAAHARDPLEAAEKALAPVHRRVTANARRLRKR